MYSSGVPADPLVITPVERCCAPTPARRATRLPPPTAYTLRSSRTASFTAPLPTLHSTKPRYFPAEVTRRAGPQRAQPPNLPLQCAATCQLITNPRRVSQRTIYIIWELFNRHVHVSPRGEHAAPRLHARHGRSLSVKCEPICGTKARQLDRCRHHVEGVPRSKRPTRWGCAPRGRWRGKLRGSLGGPHFTQGVRGSMRGRPRRSTEEERCRRGRWRRPRRRRCRREPAPRGGGGGGAPVRGTAERRRVSTQRLCVA